MKDYKGKWAALRDGKSHMNEVYEAFDKSWFSQASKDDWAKLFAEYTIGDGENS